MKMIEQQKQHILEQSWQIHDLIENSYFAYPSAKGDDGWLEKQRILLADMAIYLLQTSVKPGGIELDKLRNNLHAILTISFCRMHNLSRQPKSYTKIRLNRHRK